MKHQNISVTGSLNLNGVGVVTSASLNAYTASSDTKIDALVSKTGSYATTGSNTFTGGQIVQGTLTAQTLVVQTVTSSVDFVTGSTRFGSLQTDTHTFTGSLLLTGSLQAIGGAVNLVPSTFNVGSSTATDSNSATLQAADNNYFLRFKNAAGTSLGGFYYDGTNLVADSQNYKFGSRVNVGNMLFVSSTGTINAPSSGKSIEMLYRTDGSNDYAFIQTYDRTNSVFKPLRISASTLSLNGGGEGNVGIGTTTPLTLVHINASGYPAIRIQGGATAGGGLQFAANTDTYAELYGEYESANNGMLIFRTRGSGTVTERMRISSGGFIGIGTSDLKAWGNSFYALQIGPTGNVHNSNSGYETRITNNLWWDGANWKYLISSVGGTLLNLSSAGDYQFISTASGTAGSNASLNNRMTIFSGGDVRLNTAGMFYSSNSTVSVAPGGTTIFTPPLASGMYLVTYVIGGNATNVGYAIVGNRFGSTLYILASGAGSQTSLSVSGLNLVLSQSASGANLNTSVSYIILNSGAAV